VDAAGSQENPAHHALLGNEVYVVENLKKNLNRLPPFCPFVALPLVASPLKIRGGSGSPVRTVTLLLGR
jgi:arylformamidase